MDAEATLPDLSADEPDGVRAGHRHIVPFLLLALRVATFAVPSLVWRAVLRRRPGRVSDLSDHQLADIGLSRHDVERPGRRPTPSHPWIR